MSQRPIVLSPDLQQLRTDGYDISVEAGYLVLDDVPYVNTKREVRRGKIVAKLDLNGDATRQPDDHVSYFAGDTPCDSNGTPLPHIIGTNRQAFSERLAVNYTLSSKPPSGKYANYHEKMTTYVANIQNHAQDIDPDATAKTFAVKPAGEDSVFEYEDTASTRANIVLLTEKLRSQTIAIIGMGGTGAYILDLVAKTPVRAIHLYDGDRFGQHNAFRSPGAPSLAKLQTVLMKAEYFQALYAPMHKHITAHAYYIDAATMNELNAMTFVFICIDRNGARKQIVEYLEAAGIPFVDVGMGLPRNEDALTGIVRVTTSTPARKGHVGTFAPLADADIENEYERNIQVADLNALNAAFAVIRWKKHCGFYQDTRHEYNMTYTIRANMLVNEADE